MPFWRRFQKFFLLLARKKCQPLHSPMVTRVRFWRNNQNFLFLLRRRGKEIHFGETYWKNFNIFYPSVSTEVSMPFWWGYFWKNLIKFHLLTIRTFWCGFVRVFCKTFSKMCFSLYAEKHSVLGGAFRKNFQNFYPSRYTEIWKANWGVFFKSFSKKFIPFAIRRKK